jgi:hypothetical protein
MRTLGPRKRASARRPVALAAFAALVLFSGAASATCAYNSVSTPSGVFALTGDVCTAAAGTYSPTFQPDVSLPVTYTGFGFFAYSGGIINSPNAVTINTSGASFNNAYGAWSDGTGAQINFTGPATISTTSAGSDGLIATNGGAATLNGGSVTTSGISNAAIFATGSSSTISATGVSVSASGLSDGSYSSNGIGADSGAAMSFTGAP